MSARKIANILGFSNSTIFRELKRNAVTILEPIFEKYITKYEPNITSMYITNICNTVALLTCKWNWTHTELLYS